MRPQKSPEPPLGSVEIYYPHGIRAMRVPAGTDLNAVTLQAHDMWEEYDQKIRVRVIRYLDDGTAMGICHLPPNGEKFQP
jgi:hypothetical protein